MDLLSRSPLPVASVLWQPRADRWMFTVVCRATFLLRPGISRLAPEQEPPRAADAYWGDDEHQSLQGASELVPFKRFSEVLVTGSAHAPGGAPVTSLRVRLAVGPVHKLIEVFGDRFFTPAGPLSEPAPFTRMPLAWERAAGGPGTPNPVGVRMGGAAGPDAWGRFPVPNLQPPGRVLGSRRDVLDPVGLGALAPHWPSRVARLPPTAVGWDARRWSERPLPAGFDPWFFNVAPEDQQLPELRGDERLLLEHLHPDHPRLETTLERLAPRATVAWTAHGPTDVELRGDTLILDTDRGRATFTWRGHVPLNDPQRVDGVTISLGRPVEGASAGSAIEGTIDGGLILQQEGARSLPFVSAPAAPPRSPLPPCAHAPHPPSADEEEDEMARTCPVALVRGARSPLPFRLSTAEDLGATVTQRSPPLAPGPSSALPWPAAAPSQEPPRPALRPPSELPVLAGATPQPPPEIVGLASHVKAHRGPVAVPEGPSRSAPLPPAWIGPLAGHVSSRQSAAEGSAPLVEPLQAATPSEPAPAGPARLPLAEYPIERCAALSASLARRPDRRQDLLASHPLDPSTWEALRRRWDEALRDEARRGRADLLRAHDAAFVEQLERERGPITPEQYARLTVAAERERRDEVLVELDLPREALLPVERVYLARTMQDPRLRTSVRAAMTAARQE